MDTTTTITVVVAVAVVLEATAVEEVVTEEFGDWIMMFDSSRKISSMTLFTHREN